MRSRSIPIVLGIVVMIVTPAAQSAPILTVSEILIRLGSVGWTSKDESSFLVELPNHILVMEPGGSFHFDPDPSGEVATWGGAEVWNRINIDGSFEGGINVDAGSILDTPILIAVNANWMIDEPPAFSAIDRGLLEFSHDFEGPGSLGVQQTQEGTFPNQPTSIFFRFLATGPASAHWTLTAVPTPIPEPATAMMLLSSMIGLIVIGHRKRSHA